MIKEMWRSCGNCPIQYEGFLGNHQYFYVRARGSYVTLDIFNSKKEYSYLNSKIFHREKYYNPKKYGEFYCGWMSAIEVCKLITKWIEEYVKKHPRKFKEFN